MIRQISGTVSYISPRSVIIDVSGVGYELYLPTENLLAAQKGIPATYWTHLAVRETSMDLYGFTNQEELEFFEMLLDVSGIGPRSALGIISIASIETLRRAVANKDTSYLTKVSGIGKKTAQKIVVELADKLTDHAVPGSPELESESETLEALQSLGYTLRQSRDALKQVPQDVSGTNDRLKAALQVINRS